MPRISLLPFAAVLVLLYSALMTAVYMLTVLVRAYVPAKVRAHMPEQAQAHVPAAEETAVGEAAGDPGWRMLVPLVVFAVVILGLGLYSQPLLSFLMEIGGDAA